MLTDGHLKLTTGLWKVEILLENDYYTEQVTVLITKGKERHSFSNLFDKVLKF